MIVPKPLFERDALLFFSPFQDPVPPSRGAAARVCESTQSELATSATALSAKTAIAITTLLMAISLLTPGQRVGYLSRDGY